MPAKSVIAILLFLIIPVTPLLAQQWLGDTASGGPIYRTGYVGIGITAPTTWLRVGASGDMGVQEVARFGRDTGGHHISLGNYVTLGGLYSSGGTVLGHNVVAKLGATDALMYKTTATSVGGHAITLSHVSGITFHASGGNATAGATYAAERMRITNEGNVGIGTANPQPTLAVNGTITSKEVVVTETDWADFVFDEGDALPSLEEVARFIEENGHLPEIPSAEDVRTSGVRVGEMQAKLLQKIEELTLYLIEMQQENAALRAEVEALKARAK